MRKTVLSSSLQLVISVIIITFIVSIGYFEIDYFMNERSNQLFYSSINELVDNFNYLVDSNSIGSFLQLNLNIPNNQSIIFNNESDIIELTGSLNNNISLNVNLDNYLIISESGSYVITLCYDCFFEKEYLVSFN